MFETAINRDLVIRDAKSAAARGVIIGVAVVAIALGWFSIRWQFGSMFANLTTVSSPDAREVADAAVTLAPSDPRAYWLKGSIQAHDLSQEAMAVGMFEEAVRRAPNDFRWRMELGRSYEQNDMHERAEVEFKMARNLAPTYAFPRWQLGNFFLRQNRMDEAFAELKQATLGNHIFRDQVYSLAWDYFDKDASRVEQLAADEPDARASLAFFFASRGRGEDSLRNWNMLSEEQKAANPQTAQTIAKGLYGQRFFAQALEFSRQLGADPDAVAGAVTNAGFEDAIAAREGSQFGWQIVRSDSKLDMSSDSNVKHAGARSLKLSFKNYTKAALANLFQTVVVEPDRGYRLHFWVRTENLKSAGGPLLDVVSGVDNKLITSSKTFPLGTNDWQEMVVDFRTPGNTSGVILQTGRSYCGEACPIVGIVWYDDFLLEKL